MAECTNCYENCLKGITADLCVKYTGADNIPLGISSGNSLYTILGILISTLGAGFDGDTITVSSIGPSCTYFNAILNSTSLTLDNLAVAHTSAVCDLNNRVVALNTQVNNNYSFNTDCLTLSSSPSRDAILQGTITELCNLKTTVTTINNSYVTTENICSLVADCISAGGGTQEYTKMSKYIAYPYHGLLSVFDSQGKGLSGQGYDKVYICLGQTVNGFTLPDYRGRAVVGANTNVPLSNIDAAVNPALSGNTGYNIAVNTKMGEFKHAQLSAELAAHTHQVTDPGHTHLVNMASFTKAAGSSSSNHVEPYGSSSTNSSHTGITIASTGSSQPMNVMQPSIGTVMIMFCP